MTYTLLCDKCGRGWFLSNALEFSRLTERHRDECEGPESPSPFEGTGLGAA